MTGFHVLTESNNIKYIFLDAAEEMLVTLTARGSMWFFRVYVDPAIQYLQPGSSIKRRHMA